VSDQAVVVTPVRYDVTVVPGGTAVRTAPGSVEVVSAGPQGPPGAQGPPGPGGAGGTSGWAAVNKDAVTLARGAPVAADASGTGVVRASAASAALACVGLAGAGVAPGFAETVQTGGAVALADWSAVTGSPALLPLAVYYLDPSPGRLTASPPSEPGQLLQRVGVAVAPDTLDLDPFPDGILL
jgi:hypothetical protein